jgi:hypothetical protein
VSTHIEFHDAGSTSVTAGFPGESIGQDELELGSYALIVASDEMSVVYGTVEELENTVAQVIRALNSIKHHRADVLQTRRRLGGEGDGGSGG